MTISSVESGGSAELKQLWKNEFRTLAFLSSSVTVSSLQEVTQLPLTVLAMDLL